MAFTTSAEAPFLAVMNSTPVVEGVPQDYLADQPGTAAHPAAGKLLGGLGGNGSPAERELLRRARNDIQAVVRGDAHEDILNEHLANVSSRPQVSNRAVEWELVGRAEALPAARLVLEWDRLSRELPGRLRPCANPECSKFLIDHSKPNTARWCSMATCGNKLKARRHKERQNAIV